MTICVYNGTICNIPHNINVFLKMYFNICKSINSTKTYFSKNNTQEENLKNNIHYRKRRKLYTYL